MFQWGSNSHQSVNETNKMDLNIGMLIVHALTETKTKQKIFSHESFNKTFRNRTGPAGIWG